jgi:hypothetical protein
MTELVCMIEKAIESNDIGLNAVGRFDFRGIKKPAQSADWQAFLSKPGW